MRISSSLMLGIGLAALLVGPSVAQSKITGADTDRILEAARTLGTAELSEGPEGNPMIRGELDGLTYAVFFSNCTDNKNCEDLNFYAGFANTRPGLDTINSWNREKRFGRAYLDHEDDACVEMDLDLVQGVSAAYLESQFTLWSLVVGEFVDYVEFER
jgi:hypothetical protein